MITLRNHSIILGFVLACLMALAGFSVASAGAPVIEDPYHEEGIAELFDCGAFQVLDVYELNAVQIWFFDEAGNRLRFIEQVWGTDTFTNSVTGEAYAMSYHNTVIVDFTTSPPLGANMGVVFRLNVPGAGAVFLDVGRVVLDRAGNVYFRAGPHQFIDGDIDGVCEALG